ncbi:protein-glutamine gamma-glutamyltransferase 2-like [Kryptolebias marmoratus]|uniref:Protein-glutamine gamma-glutamyltransferase 2 n=1 Tax=Kryptolebias marmoratus TaxID=37003 RepID=A0A3Q2ZQE5_KRYMA|nr:protein-glutamine gamma-glutamyltransferase 2-like [Kryptolebias marmoratus]
MQTMMKNDIRRMDLHCRSNNAAHHTDEISTRQLIVRRGQPFVLTLEMRNPFQRSDILQLTVETGPAPSGGDGTQCSFGNPAPFYASGTKAIWRYDIDPRSVLQRGVVTLSVVPPADAPVGRYFLSAETNSGRTCRESLVVLFNPWCSDDWVYLPDEKQKQEYVLNEQGAIYTGTAHYPTEMRWEFGQFEEEMVDICLKLLDVNPKYLRDPAKDVSARCNPIYVSRVVSAMINSNDDMGVLTGCWQGSYSDGISPSRWTGSVSILQRWYQTGCRAVKYGQCWVFAGVMCTVMRFFGIPCRVVTNFNSAHDTDNSLTIDEYFSDHGLNSRDGVDSIWNFHVWVEGWMKRPDLHKSNIYDGWQVLDATPQEKSGGVFCCGPAPVTAVLRGDLDLKYDTPFVFSEVNADVVKWLVSSDGSKRKIHSLCDTARVGQKISTKAIGCFARDDITNRYKFKEGSSQERTVYNQAVQRLNSKEDYAACQMMPPKGVDMVLKEETRLQNGEDIHLRLKLSNMEKKNKKMYIHINGQAMKYTRKHIQNFLYTMLQKTLLAGQDMDIPIHIPFSAYSKYMVDFDSIKVSILASDDDGDVYETEMDFALEHPPISVKVVGNARLNRPMTMQVEFKNPLNETLRGCSLTVIGCGLFRSDYLESELSDLGPNSTLTMVITTMPYKLGLKTVMVDFDCSYFRDVKGSCTVNVTP